MKDFFNLIRRGKNIIVIVIMVVFFLSLAASTNAFLGERSVFQKILPKNIIKNISNKDRIETTKTIPEITDNYKVYNTKQEQEVVTEDKLRICPDAWYENRMPRVIREGDKAPSFSQYFIIDGQRKEVDKFDILWIKQNCKINKASIVY